LEKVAMNVIAERQLTFKDESSTSKDVRVVLGRPTKSNDMEEYSCEVQILGLGDEKVRRIYGIDSMQALQLAIGFISGMLNLYRPGLTWLGNDNIGF
jgi:hypothetical protein